MSTVGQPIVCKAAVCWKANQPVSIEDVTVAPPQAHEIRVRLTAAHICHTDSLVLEGLDNEGVYPVILGHEGAGVVESIGEGVTRCKVGDHVIPCYIPECRECKFCLSNKTNLCSKIRVTQGKGLLPDGTSRFTCKDQSIFHFMGCSTFSEYTVLAEISVAVVRRDAPLDKIGLLGCGITTGYGAATKTAKVTPGSTVGIWGLGGVGSAVAQGARASGAKRIIGIDTNPDKFPFALQMGCTEVFNPKDHPGKNVVEVLTSMTDGGFDYTFECIGNVVTMRQALEACHKGWGESTIIGVAAAGTEISTRPFQLVTGRVWRGSAFGGFKGPSDLPRLVDLYLDGKLKVDEYISYKLPLADINKGFELMHDGKSIRSSVYFGAIN